ncbi:uncharacterized protein CBL_13335 [Carabus blaptoides fortunei]
MAFRHSLKRVNPLIFQYTVRNFASAEKLVDTTVNDKGIATITLQRPPVNSLNYELLSALLESLQDVGGSKTRGVILTSSSSSVFSAGLDIMEMYKPTEDRLAKFWTALQDTWLELYGSLYPTVAAINGHSPAGGCLLSMCCEYRVMLPKFTIGLNETQLGIVAPTWFQSPMRNIIGDRQAELALTTGRMFTTDEALKVGLIDEIASDKTDLITKAENFLNRFAKIPPAARSLSKVSFRARDIKALEKNREQDLQMFLAVVTQPDVQKGLGKYIESLKKRASA